MVFPEEPFLIRHWSVHKHVVDMRPTCCVLTVVARQARSRESTTSLTSSDKSIASSRRKNQGETCWFFGAGGLTP
eukprot:5497958-Amphidinium_carterae.1